MRISPPSLPCPSAAHADPTPAAALSATPEPALEHGGVEDAEPRATTQSSSAETVELRAPVSEHSEKPHELVDRVESLSPGRKVEPVRAPSSALVIAAKKGGDRPPFRASGGAMQPTALPDVRRFVAKLRERAARPSQARADAHLLSLEPPPSEISVPPLLPVPHLRPVSVTDDLPPTVPAGPTLRDACALAPTTRASRPRPAVTT